MQASSVHGLPPAFVVTVHQDPLRDEGIGYAAQLAKAGVAVELHHLPEHMHGLFTSGGLVRSAAHLLDLAETSINRAGDTK
ncbi:alpha/beta hydrolase [Streptomyces sp. NPDC004250]|uniref:alpha/beta hydrolase n=1 Tax=Streptomyces sp. NPDC004250 TaxID=3364692 RepID=UPI00367F57B6